MKLPAFYIYNFTFFRGDNILYMRRFIYTGTWYIFTQTRSKVDVDMIQFHNDLRDTCIDLMSRYTFSSCGPHAKRWEERVVFNLLILTLYTVTCVMQLLWCILIDCLVDFYWSIHRGTVCDMLLEDGQQQTWIWGNKIITITTSGCSQRPLRNGLCDKCFQQCIEKTDGERDSFLFLLSWYLSEVVN